jgi:hypothetical protein
MSINGLLFLNTQIRKDYERTMRVRLMKQRHEALAASVAAVAAVAVAAGGLQDASSQEPNHPFDVKPWPEDARPKVDMPV